MKGAARARSRGEKSCWKSSAGNVFAKLKKVERGYLLNITHKVLVCLYNFLIFKHYVISNLEILAQELVGIDSFSFLNNREEFFFGQQTCGKS